MVSLQLCRLPITVFDIKGIPCERRERIEAAIVVGGKHIAEPHKAWVAALVPGAGSRRSSRARTDTSERRGSRWVKPRR